MLGILTDVVIVKQDFHKAVPKEIKMELASFLYPGSQQCAFFSDPAQYAVSASYPGNPLFQKHSKKSLITAYLYLSCH